MRYLANEYLYQLLRKYNPKSLSDYADSLSNIKDVLRKWASSCFVEILESGSRSKGTAISLGSDVDYLVSLSSGCNEKSGGLKSCYTSLYICLSDRYQNVRKQNVSIRLILGEIELDITPARKHAEAGGYHSLYSSKHDSWTQTNINIHIAHVSESGRTNEIKLLKIWRELNRIDFPSIYLEYLIIKKILFGKSKEITALSSNLYNIFKALAMPSQENPLFTRIIDPSNSNNLLSDLLTQQEKRIVITHAQKALEANAWHEIIW